MQYCACQYCIAQHVVQIKLSSCCIGVVLSLLGPTSKPRIGQYTAKILSKLWISWTIWPYLACLELVGKTAVSRHKDRISQIPDALFIPLHSVRRPARCIANHRELGRPFLRSYNIHSLHSCVHESMRIVLKIMLMNAVRLTLGRTLPLNETLEVETKEQRKPRYT